MRALKYLFAGLLIAELTFSWTLPKANGQDYYSQDEQNKKVLKQAVMGAGVGAVASGASGGSTGKGALIGAGTNVIGSAVLDTLTTSQAPQQQSQPQIQYVEQVPERGYTAAESAPRNGGCGRGR